ncbi:hypothetical protein SNE40_013664 [Patella caerulea]|uniref:Fucosyltransferase n=1 Tax=Patella caerulea TaxID=87958 RepID=A0AAN8JC15_PATCE
MFYLSFENALCKDYVTEKFYRYYKYDTIQIVRARINYSEIAPQGTFVDTADFKSVEQLGNYLKSLAQDEVKYTDYLKRKDAYASIFEEYQFPLTRTSYFTHSHYFKQPLCDLCQIDLSTTHAQPKYPDVYQWFQRDMCHTPEDIQ